MKNWLSIVVFVYLIGMVLYGHHKGFIKLAVSMVALAATIILVNIAMPGVTSLLKEKTPIYTAIQGSMEKIATAYEGNQGSEELPAFQRQAIEQMNLPQQLKQVLIENNNNEVYQMLGVHAFIDYVTSYLANIILNIIGFVAMFIIVYIIIQLAMRWLDLVAKLPVLSGMNQLAGAVLGGLQGLVFLWILCLIVTACSGTEWGMAVIKQIESSTWLSFLYDFNLLSKIVIGAIKVIL